MKRKNKAKKIMALIATAVLAFSVLTVGTSGFVSAECSEITTETNNEIGLHSENEIEIEDWHDLNNTRDNLDEDYILVNDLDEDTDGFDEHVGDLDDGWVPIGNDTHPFNGTFDGQNHTIFDLHISRSTAGLFSHTTDEATLTNIGLKNANVSAGSNSGTLVANNGGLVYNSFATGKVTGGSNLGGLVGRNAGSGTVINSHATSKVNGSSNVGGLVGNNQNLVEDSHATGDVDADGSWSDVGGLVGWNADTVNSSYATGDVTGEDIAGGLVGANYDALVNNSYATGNVSVGDWMAGGLVGENDLSTVNHSYATGNVTGEDTIGALIGHSFGWVYNSFANEDNNPDLEWYGEAYGDMINVGMRTTEEMTYPHEEDDDTFYIFDEDIWFLDDHDLVEDHEGNTGYPALEWQWQEFTLNIESTDGGEVVDPGEDEFEYEQESLVDLVAVADDNYHFVEWTGDIEEIEEPESADTTIEMLDDYSITAEFAIDTHDLTVDSTDGGEVIEPGEDTFEYDHGNEVDLEAVADEDYHFVEWTGDIEEIEEPESADTTIEMLDDYSITAMFEKVPLEEYELTINAEEGGTTDPDAGTHTYEEGTEVAVEAIPEEGYEFDEWTGDYEDDDKEITITMDENKEITAWFEEKIVEYELTINAEEGGTTDPDPDTYTYEEGTEVTVEAIPDEGYEFDEWTGDYTGTDEEITITIDEDKEITAWFEEIPTYDLTVNIDGEGSVDIDPDQDEYEVGEEVILTAEPDDDWEFDEWTGDYSGTDEEITLTMDEDKEITAVFEEEDDDIPGFTLALLILGTVIAVAIYHKKKW